MSLHVFFGYKAPRGKAQARLTLLKLHNEKQASFSVKPRSERISRLHLDGVRACTVSRVLLRAYREVTIPFDLW